MRASLWAPPTRWSMVTGLSTAKANASEGSRPRLRASLGMEKAMRPTPSRASMRSSTRSGSTW